MRMTLTKIDPSNLPHGGENAEVKYTSIMTTPFREMTEAKFGALDAATSFMYLFLRFGTPNQANDDDYKLLFEYRLTYEDLTIIIHGSHHNFVHFNLLLPTSRLDTYDAQKKDFLIHLYEKYKQFPFIPTAIQNVYLGISYLTPEQHKENLPILDEACMKLFSLEEQQRITGLLKQEHRSPEDQAYLSKSLYGAFEILSGEFQKHLTPDEKKRLYQFFPAITEIDGLETQLNSVFNELLTARYIRDVPINILGYTSPLNPMVFEGS